MPVGTSRYRFSGFVLDVGERTLHADGRDLYLPPKTFETLRFLVERPGHLVTKAELLDAVWPGVAVTENALTRCIKEVRAALGDDAHAPRCIETVPRVGYRFVAPVEVLQAAEESGSADSPPGGPGGEPAAAAAGTAAEAPGPQPPRGPSSWSRRALMLVTLAGVLVLVPVGSFLATPPGRGAVLGPRQFVLVADVENQTGEADLDRALTSAFTSLLEQSPYANVYPRAMVVSTLQRMGKSAGQRLDEPVARELCVREGIAGLVTLTVTRVGHRYTVGARLLAPQTGATVAGRAATADGRDELLDAVRTAAIGLRSDLGESLVSIESSNRPLAQVTTSSLKALQAYSDAQALWDRGQHTSAVRLYREAVEEDPEFAKAHAALGAAYYSTVFGDRARGDEHFAQALRLAHRTTDRERRSIQASWEQQRGHSEVAADLYRGYLQRYPDDFRARLQLAAVLRDLGRFDEAVQQYQEGLRLAPNHASAHVNLATCFTPLGRYGQALKQYEAAFALEPRWRTSGNIAHEYGFSLVRAGHAAKAREHFAGMLTTDMRPSALRSLGLLDMYEGRFTEARTKLAEALATSSANGPSVTAARNALLLAIAEQALGRLGEARQQVRLAAETARAAKVNTWLLSRVGVEAARLGERPTAAALLEEVSRRTDAESPEQLADLRRLEGESALAGGDVSRAIERLVLAETGRHSAFTVSSLARAHDVAGHRDETVRLLEQLLGMEPVALGFEPQQDWLAAHVRLAQLRLLRGELEAAASVTAALERRWSGADESAASVRALRAVRAAIDERQAARARRP